MQLLYEKRMVLLLANIPDQIRSILGTPTIENLMMKYKLDLYAFRLMFQEVLANAIEHGNQQRVLPIHIRVTLEDSILMIDVMDSGEGFEFLPTPQPHYEDYVNDRGRGLAIIRAYGFDYRHFGTGNHIRVSFDFTKKHPYAEV